MKLHIFYYGDDGSLIPGIACTSFDEAIEYIEALRLRADHVPDEEPPMTEKQYAQQEVESHLHP